MDNQVDQIKLAHLRNDARMSNTPNIVFLSEEEKASLKDVMHIQVIKKEKKDGD